MLNIMTFERSPICNVSHLQQRATTIPRVVNCCTVYHLTNKSKLYALIVWGLYVTGMGRNWLLVEQILMMVMMILIS